jgi:hypothetical protein
VSGNSVGTNALDGDPGTEWVPGGTEPAALVIVPPRARLVSRIELEPRQDFWYGSIVLESWHDVQVVLYREGREVARQVFSLPDDAPQPVQLLNLDRPAVADKIEIQFSQPVTEILSGDGRADRAPREPGYREIRIH